MFIVVVLIFTTVSQFLFDFYIKYFINYAILDKVWSNNGNLTAVIFYKHLIVLC